MLPLTTILIMKKQKDSENAVKSTFLSLLLLCGDMIL